MMTCLLLENETLAFHRLKAKEYLFKLVLVIISLQQHIPGRQLWLDQVGEGRAGCE